MPKVLNPKDNTERRIPSLAAQITKSLTSQNNLRFSFSLNSTDSNSPVRQTEMSKMCQSSEGAQLVASKQQPLGLKNEASVGVPKNALDADRSRLQK